MPTRGEGVQHRAPWWLRPQVASVLLVLLLAFDRLVVRGIVVPLAVLALAAAIIVLVLALLHPALRARWFQRGPH